MPFLKIYSVCICLGWDNVLIIQVLQCVNYRACDEGKSLTCALINPYPLQAQMNNFQLNLTSH